MSLLVVMGSGETAPSLVKVHREVDLATRGDGPAVLLDTTFGFQVNADDLVERTSAYFKASVGLPVELASWRRADAPQVERERTLALLGRARWAFAGPGSPTYTLRHPSPFPSIFHFWETLCAPATRCCWTMAQKRWRSSAPIRTRFKPK